MTYTLYSRKDTGGFAVEAALAKAHADTKVIEIDKSSQRTSADFGKLNPMRQVPTLVLPDGTVMTESAAMVIHVADAFPTSELAQRPGSTAHARFLRWMLFMAVNLYEADALLLCRALYGRSGWCPCRQSRGSGAHAPFSRHH
jgi:glutathione S-transferase